MTTPLGKFLRKLRIDQGELLRDMANKLDVSSAFLSSVENGKKKMPENWKTKILEVYQLNANKKNEFYEAVELSSNVIKLNIEGATESNQELAILFARHFVSLDYETTDQIKKILVKYGEGN